MSISLGEWSTSGNRPARRDTKTPESKRSLILPKRAITALKAYKVRQDRERAAAGAAWQENDLVFCHAYGTMDTADASTGASPG